MDSPVLLFPHGAVSERDLKRGVALFGPLEICQPWFLEAPALGEALDRFVRFLRPPVEMKPKEDLKALLSEYLTWGREHRKEDLGAFLRAARAADPSDGAGWEIRQKIRRMDGPSPAQDHALKRHMVLHLYEEIEKNRREAADMLQRLKRVGSPLTEALGEGVEVQGLFDDLPLEDAFLPADAQHLHQVLDAWTHLFESAFQRSSALLTFDSRIMAHLREAFSPATEGREGGHPSFLRFGLPDFSALSVEDLLTARSDASLASLSKELNGLVQGVPDPTPSAERIAALSAGLVQAYSDGMDPSGVQLSLLRTPSPAELEGAPDAAEADGFAGKTILLLEGAPSHG